MNWRTQKLQVDMLSAQVRAEECKILLHKNALRQWRHEAFGTTSTLAWSFAAGTAWGLARRSDAPKSRFRRAVVAASNASLLAWRIANVKT